VAPERQEGYPAMNLDERHREVGFVALASAVSDEEHEETLAVRYL
jgi:hypothetical protein